MLLSLELIIAADRMGVLKDFKGVASHAYSGIPIDEAVFRFAGYVLRDEQAWHDVGNADSTRQSPGWGGRRGLYADPSHEMINPNLTADDYVGVTMANMRRQAACLHEGSPEANWLKMLEVYGNQVNPPMKPIPAHQVAQVVPPRRTGWRERLRLIVTRQASYTV